MIKKNFITAVIAGTVACVSIAKNASAQMALMNDDDPRMKIYRETPPKINDLVNTKLDVHFDYKKCYLYGKEWVTLKPHIYPTDTLRLDAKGMDIHNVSVVKNGKNIPLKYDYQDSLSLAIHLDKVYHDNEPYTIYIDYTSKPNQIKQFGSAAINEAKGLYFINPDGSDPNKPVQIWTQGETESSSCWFPTIDKPEQKTTEEIVMTVPAKYVSLSNGKMISQKVNGDGTRTDTWKMDQPHSPYLFMMAVGDFKIYHDKWRNVPVDYYLEPKYAPYAKDIFGDTPEMIDFYSKLLGVDYPWNKYAQIVVRDYVSGAMENTSATLHGAQVQETGRELLDAYYNESRVDIAHELFHQWFGDYVTCESWSNITMNESFADFSEMLWAEHKYGKDEADFQNYKDMDEYIEGPGNDKKPLVRFHYIDREDVFDYVSYQKGGRILNMLRNYLGDAAFFKGLNIYLKTNAYKTGEAQQLRLALEEASGRDLNWFFNQWYYGAGHPVLTINYKWDDAAKTQYVYLQQTQEGQTFTLPFAVDIYAGGKKIRHNVWMRNKADTLKFASDEKPELVNVDGDKVLLALKTDNKPVEQYEYQYFHAPLFLDRHEALDVAAAHQRDAGAQKVLIAALNDKYYRMRQKAIQLLALTNDDVKAQAIPVLRTLAQNDPNTLVRAEAINKLGMLKDAADAGIFETATQNRSYAVAGAGLNAMSKLDPTKAFKLAKSLERDAGGSLSLNIVRTYVRSGGGDAEWPFIYKTYKDGTAQIRFTLAAEFATMTAHVTNPVYAQQGIELIKENGLKYKAYGADRNAIQILNGPVKASRTKMNDNASLKAIEQAVAELQK